MILIHVLRMGKKIFIALHIYRNYHQEILEALEVLRIVVYHQGINFKLHYECQYL